MSCFNIILDGCQERGGEIAIFEKIVTVLEVDNSDFGLDGGGLGFLVEFDEGLFGLGKMVVDNVGSGGAENARDFAITGDETSET